MRNARVFRQAAKEDIGEIAEMEKEIFRDPWTANGIYETFLQKNSFIAVAEKDGRAVGYLIMYHAADEAEIARIAVKDGYRRQGLGRGILSYALGLCAENEIRKVMLDVRENNLSARQFYLRYGFKEDGVRKDYYSNPKEDAVLMSMIPGQHGNGAGRNPW